MSGRIMKGKLEQRSRAWQWVPRQGVQLQYTDMTGATAGITFGYSLRQRQGAISFRRYQRQRKPKRHRRSSGEAAATITSDADHKTAHLRASLPRAIRSSHLSRQFTDWCDSYEDVCSWFDQHGDLEARVDAAGGLLRIENFLPHHIAEAGLALLHSLPKDIWLKNCWHQSSAKERKHNNIEHEFRSIKAAPGTSLEAFLRVFSAIRPGELNAFSAGKYERSHMIAPHDDRAYTDCVMDDGTTLECSRDLAVIYYLTHDWCEDYGGTLVDVETGSRYTPRFNSIVLFRVPRYHEVEAVTGRSPLPRYSVFGWFLKPGRLYDLKLTVQP